jgi:O-antigen ligase
MSHVQVTNPRNDLFAQKIVRSLYEFAWQTIFLVLIVFGTYGTFEGGLEATNQSYLQPAFLLTIALMTWLLALEVFRGGTFSSWILFEHEGVLLFLFFLSSLIGVLGAPQKLPGLLATLYATAVTLLFVTSRVRNKLAFLEIFQFFVKLIYLTSVIAFLAGAYTYWVGSFTVGPLLIEYNELFWRVNSWFMTSTGFGAFLGLGVISASYYISNAQTSIGRFAHGILLVCLLVGMAISGARSSISAMVVAWVFLAIVTFNLRMRYVVGAIGVMVVLVFIFVAFGEDAQEILIVRRFLDDTDTITLGGRTDMWGEAMDIFLTLSVFKLVFGSGFGTFSETLGWDIGAHSGYLRVAIEHGILGISLFAVFISRSLSLLVKEVRYSRGTKIEVKILLLYYVMFSSAELVLPQLLGISMEYILFLTVVALSASRRRLYPPQPQLLS